VPITPYPLRLDPYLSRPIWGGRKLATRYGKGGTSSESLGESWEIWEGDVVQNGAWTGRILSDLTTELGPALLGTDLHGEASARFPLLIKLIDATEQLSIQVHPNDKQAQALEHEPFGKTEAWYILDAAPDAKLVYGLAHEMSHDELRERAASGSIERDLSYLAVRPGDVVLVPAGTIHAIGAGIVLYEIQQTSKTTYRLYDWNRRGPDGQMRELHLDKAVAVALRSPGANGRQRPRELTQDSGVRRWELVRCPYFVLERAALSDPWTYRQDGRSFAGLTCTKGSFHLHALGGSWPAEPVREGGSILLPASLAECAIMPDGQDVEVLIAHLP